MGTEGKQLRILIGIAALFCAVILGYQLFFVREPSQTILLQGEAVVSQTESPSQSAAPETPGSGKIDLNHATAEQLQTLPGIGEVLSARIVAYREAHGGFTSITELLEVPGIGEKTFAKIQNQIEVTP